MAEGLFNPLTFPFPPRLAPAQLLKSVVKVRPKRTLRFEVFSTEKEADEFSRVAVDTLGFETFYLGYTQDDFNKSYDPNFSNQLFSHEFCELIKTGATFPAETTLQGNGTGVLLSSDGLVVTNFHLVSGIVEAAGLLETGKFGGPLLDAPSLSVDVLESMENGTLTYRRYDSVKLVATFSRSDAYSKRLDLALLKIDLKNHPEFLKISTRDAQRFERIFSLGFSMRTARSEEQKNKLGYEDADDSLRAAAGLVVQLDDNSFLSDVDRAPGNSGSATLNENGELVGIYSGSTGNGITDYSKGGYSRHVLASNIQKLLPACKFM